MPRTADVDLSTPTSRRRLLPLPNSEVYWRKIAEGQHLGYRRTTSGAGTWWVRLYLGDGKYTSNQSIGSADDLVDSDGRNVLSYREALAVASAWWQSERQRLAGGETRIIKAFLVRDAVASYRSWFRVQRKGIERTEIVLAQIEESLGALQLAGPPSNARPATKRAFRAWHQGIAETPARLRGRTGEIRYRSLSTDEEKRKRKNTANRCLTILKALLNFAVSEGDVPKAMADTWDVRPFRGVDAPRVRHLEQDELVALLDSISDSDFHALVEGASHTGCDYGEIRKMNVGDFLSQAGAVQVREGKALPRSRIIYLTEEGIDFFNRQVTGRPSNTPMFTRNGTRWKRSEQDRPLRQACIAAKISRISFHILRHTYASLYLMNGGDLPGLSKQLGHADTRMTMRHYAHLAERWRAQDAGRHAPRWTTPAPTGPAPAVNDALERFQRSYAELALAAERSGLPLAKLLGKARLISEAADP